MWRSRNYSRQWYGGQRGQLRRTALRYALASGILALVVFGALAALYQWATGLVLGAEFEGSELLLLMMIPGSFIATAVSVLTALPAAAGRVWPSLAGSLAGLGSFRRANRVADAGIRSRRGSIGEFSIFRRIRGSGNALRPRNTAPKGGRAAW